MRLAAARWRNTCDAAFDVRVGAFFLVARTRNARGSDIC